MDERTFVSGPASFHPDSDADVVASTIYFHQSKHAVGGFAEQGSVLLFAVVGGQDRTAAVVVVEQRVGQVGRF